MKKGTLIVMAGPPGSGKSTQAAKMLQNDPLDTVIVGRDKIRELLFGYVETDVVEYFQHEHYSHWEQEVTAMQELMIREGLRKGKTVIVDDTNCKVERIQKFFRDYRNYDCGLWLCDTPLDLCQGRVYNRNRTLPAEGVKRMWDAFQKVKEAMLEEFVPAFEFTPYGGIASMDPNRSGEKGYGMRVYIVDLDGTLAAKSEHRSMFSPTTAEILDDRVVEPVAQFIHNAKKAHIRTIFLSGREEKFREATTKWLINRGIYQKPELYMRPDKDNRRDDIVKHELFWKHIAPKYHVLGAVDDRHQVLDMWTAIGVFTFSVNQHREHF